MKKILVLFLLVSSIAIANVISTIAAYNAGEGAVKRFKGEVPAYKETKTYVKRVMSLYDKFFQAYQKKSLNNAINMD